jgi:hypothetical protein
MTQGGGGGPKIGKKSVTYYLNGPLHPLCKLIHRPKKWTVTDKRHNKYIMKMYPYTTLPPARKKVAVPLENLNLDKKLNDLHKSK